MAKDSIKDSKILADALSMANTRESVDSTETSKKTTQGQIDEETLVKKHLAVQREKTRAAQHAVQTELGSIGKIWGGGKEKAGNIAGIAVSASFLLLVVVIVVTVIGNILGMTNIAVLREAFTVVTSVLTLSLGYLFGQGSGGR